MEMKTDVSTKWPLRLGMVSLAAALSVVGASAQISTGPSGGQANLIQVQLNAPATVPVMIHSWGAGLRTLQAGDTCWGTVAGNVYEGYTSVIPDGTPVVGRVINVEQPAQDGASVNLKLEMIWAALPAADGRSEITSIGTAPLEVSVADGDIKDARVFWFRTAAPLVTEVPLVDGEPQAAPAISKTALFSKKLGR